MLLLALLIGTGIRFWWIAHTPLQDFAVDKLFDTLGWNLATGKGFTLDGVTPSAHVAPGYPALLAVFYTLVGHRPDWVPYLHVLFDLGTALCVYRVAGHLFDQRVATFAATAVLLYPAYWTFDIRIRSESLLTLLVSAWLWVVIYAEGSTHLRKYVLCGLTAGVVLLCKPVLTPIVLLIALEPFASSRMNRNALARMAVYLGCVLLVVLPWTVRNYQDFGSFIPISSGVGAGLWTGSDPISQGSWPMPFSVEDQIWMTAGLMPLKYPHAMYEVSADQSLKQKGWARIRANTWQYLRLVFKRVFHLWIGNRYYLYNGNSGFVEGFRQDAQARGTVVAGYSMAKRLFFQPGLLLLALWGGWSQRARWRKIFPLYTFPIGLTLGYIPFAAEAGRYALPVLPCVFILAIVAICSVRMAPHRLKAGVVSLGQARS